MRIRRTPLRIGADLYIGKTVDHSAEVTTRYLWLGQNIVAELDEDDEVLRRYVHGACVDEPVPMKPCLHHSDLIGLPSRITLISTRQFLLLLK